MSAPRVCSPTIALLHKRVPATEEVYVRTLSDCIPTTHNRRRRRIKICYIFIYLRVFRCLSSGSICDIMYKNIICFFSFPFITQNVRRVRESRRWPRCIHKGEIWIFGEPLLLRSTFARIVEGHLGTLNYFWFSSLLYFHESRTEPSQRTESSKFFLTF